MNNEQETAEEFVTRKLTGLTTKTIPFLSDSIFHVDENGEFIICTRTGGRIDCRYPEFLSVLHEKYNLDYNETMLFMKNILEQHFNIKGCLIVAISDGASGVTDRLLKENSTVSE